MGIIWEIVAEDLRENMVAAVKRAAEQGREEFHPKTIEEPLSKTVEKLRELKGEWGEDAIKEVIELRHGDDT